MELLVHYHLHDCLNKILSIQFWVHVLMKDKYNMGNESIIFKKTNKLFIIKCKKKKCLLARTIHNQIFTYFYTDYKLWDQRLLSIVIFTMSKKVKSWTETYINNVSDNSYIESEPLLFYDKNSPIILRTWLVSIIKI